MQVVRLWMWLMVWLLSWLGGTLQYNYHWRRCNAECLSLANIRRLVFSVGCMCRVSFWTAPRRIRVPRWLPPWVTVSHWFNHHFGWGIKINHNWTSYWTLGLVRPWLETLPPPTCLPCSPGWRAPVRTAPSWWGSGPLCPGVIWHHPRMMMPS